MNLDQKYLALDLELNNAQDGSTPNPKIIQVGVAIGSARQDPKEWITKKWYVKINDPIYPFITDLTGITTQDIQQFGMTHYDIGQELSRLIKEHDVFVNPVTWGGGDSTELKDEFNQHGIEFRHFGRRWIDVKTWYTLRLLANGKRPSGGLSSAMGVYKLQFEGEAHRADVDAYNTLRLFFEILKRQKQMLDTVSLAKGL
jgi:inhibitor of KinA sporulation pathway (predicted exonuclease)